MYTGCSLLFDIFVVTAKEMREKRQEEHIPDSPGHSRHFKRMGVRMTEKDPPRRKREGLKRQS
jgi:hypothetical protein